MSCGQPDNPRKKMKANDEPTIYKDLTSRNAVLTIYRDINEDNLEQESQKLPLSDQINLAVTWLSNYQVVLIEKNEQAKTNDKFSIKNILTTQNKRNFEFKHQKNPTLQNYVFEAVEKQQEGVIDNVLLLIQPKIQDQELYSINYFGISVANQIQQSKKLQALKENVKGNKVVYINLTGRESEKNLEYLDEIIQKEDELLYFSFYKVQNQNAQLKQFQKQFQQMHASTCQQFIIPFICEDGKFNGNYLYSLFEMFLYNKIEKIPNLGYIALSLEISDQIEYEDYGLQQLIQALMNLSHQKLIVHAHIIENGSNEFEIKLKQGINMCYYSILEKCKNKEKHLQYSDRLKLIQLLEQTHQLYFQNDIVQWSENQSLIKALYIKSSSQPKQFIKIQEEVKDQYAIFYKQNSQKILIIIPILEEPYKITDQTEIRIDYAERLILIYHDEICHDNRSFFLFYAKTTDEYLQAHKKTKILQSNNEPRNRIELQFTKIELAVDLQFFLYPVMFQKDSIIYFLYGRLKEKDGVNFICYRYQLNDKYQFNKNRWDSLNRVEKDNKLNLFSTRVSLKKLQQDEVQKIIQYRSRVSVSFENSKNENTILVILFGGENDQTPQIVNSIEIVEINLVELVYSSWFVDKYQIYREITFKPFPNQIILQGIEDSPAQAVNYIFLSGNDQIRREKRNHPINQSIPEQVTVLRKTTSECSMKKIKLDYIDRQYFDITYFNNRQYNVQLVSKNKRTIVWRIIFFETLTDEATYKTLTSLDIFVQGRTSNFLASYKQQYLNPLFEESQEMPTDDKVLEYFQKYLQEKPQNEEAQLQKSQRIETEDFENYPLQNQQQQESEKVTTIEEESNQTFNISQLEIIEDTLLNKLVSKKFFLAFENYIFYDYKSKNLYLKQYIYQVLDPIKTKIFDIEEPTDLEGRLAFQPPLKGQPQQKGQELQRTAL